MPNLKKSRWPNGHQGKEAWCEQWLTPPEIIHALGPFDLDPCSPTVRPYETARHYYTKNDDGLSQDWFGHVWLNPPYGNETIHWVRRLAEHGNGIALLFARTETKTFFPWVWDYADAIFFLQGRLYFHRIDGSRSNNNAGAPSVLIAYGKGSACRLRDCDLPGRFVALKIP